MNRQYLKKHPLPDSPGVYFFKKGKQILYIGKATNLKDRVKSYFSNDLISTRGAFLVGMVTLAESIRVQKTDSVLEAFLLETELIKKYRPKYNTKEKDDKSFNFCVITDEDFPRVLIERGRVLDMDQNRDKYKYIFGPFPYGSELKEAMRLVRKIFPYRDKCEPSQGKPCFNYHIGLCPGVCVGLVTKKEYALNMENIRLFFEGKKQKIINSLNLQMKKSAKSLEFEKANKTKKTIYALNHIQDISLIKNESRKDKDFLNSKNSNQKNFRIESYDIAHMSGKNMVGVMSVSVNGQLNKSEYRKFIIRQYDSSNDTGALREIIERRLKHTEWSMPDLVVIDGGKAQLTLAKKLFSNYGSSNSEDVKVVSVVKDDKHKAREILGINKASEKYSPDIIKINAETHKYAINFHRKRRKMTF